MNGQEPKSAEVKQAEADAYAKFATLVALLCIAGGVVTLVPLFEIKSESNLPVYFVMLALIAMAWPSVRNMKFGKDGISLERFEEMRHDVTKMDATIAELDRAVKQVEKTGKELAVQVSELSRALEGIHLGNRELKLLLEEVRGSGTGSPQSSQSVPKPRAGDSVPPGLSRKSARDDDLQKGRWGGKPEANGWRLWASVTESALDSKWYVIELEVRSSMPNRALRGPVSFFVHQSFPQERYDVDARRGVAHLELRAWGAFTVGAWIHEDGTELELDLSELDGAPPEFRVL